MQKLYAALDKSVTKLGWTLILIALVIVGGSISVTVRQIFEISGQGILDFELGHSKASINEILGAYGEEGMRLYQRVQLLDLVNPILYSWLSAMLIYLLVKGSRWSWLVLFALLPGLFDYVENYYLYQFVSSYPMIDPNQVSIANVLSLIKRGVFVLAVSALVFGLVIKIQTRIQTRGDK